MFRASLQLLRHKAIQMQTPSLGCFALSRLRSPPLREQAILLNYAVEASLQFDTYVEQHCVLHSPLADPAEELLHDDDCIIHRPDASSVPAHFLFDPFQAPRGLTELFFQKLSQHQSCA